MDEIHEFRFTVPDEDIDELEHAGNLSYLRWMMRAAMSHTAANGWPWERYRREGQGWIVRSHQVDYLKPALPGDEVVVRTWVATMKKASSERRYEVMRGDEVLARGRTEWAFVDLKTLAPKRIPPEVSDCFRIVEK